MDFAAANDAIWFPLAYALHIVAERHEALSENLRLPIDRSQVPMLQQQVFRSPWTPVPTKARSELFELPAATLRAACPP